MLRYKQAFEKVLKHSFTLKTKFLLLSETLGLVVAQNIFSREPFPSFDNSAVDGYAIRLPSSNAAQGLLRRPGSLLAMTSLRAKRSNLNFKVQGEVRAGKMFKEALRPNHALRIFTGAPVPIGTHAVVMQEHAERVNGHITLLKLPQLNDNIRFYGEDFQKGKILVQKGTLLSPTHLALLATTGYKKIPVFPSPRVAIMATGSELLKLDERLKPGKIRDSNSVLLEALVKQTAGHSVSVQSVSDNSEMIRSLIRKGLKSDLLLISGGVSVGKYDLVRGVLKEEGVKEIFWKVNIKPGKPLFFGKKNRTLVFGLPGNPVSVFVTFEEFVKPAMLKMMGKNQEQAEKKASGYLTKPFQNGSRLHFVRIRCIRNKNGYAVTPLKGQGSHMIGSLAASNGILKVEPNRIFKKNERVSIKLF